MQCHTNCIIRLPQHIYKYIAKITNLRLHTKWNLIAVYLTRTINSAHLSLYLFVLIKLNYTMTFSRHGVSMVSRQKAVITSRQAIKIRFAQYKYKKARFGDRVSISLLLSFSISVPTLFSFGVIFQVLRFCLVIHVRAYFQITLSSLLQCTRTQRSLVDTEASDQLVDFTRNIHSLLRTCHRRR